MKIVSDGYLPDTGTAILPLISPRHPWLIGTAMGSIYLTDRKGRIIEAFEGHTSSITTLAITHDNSTLVSADQFGQIYFWDWDDLTKRGRRFEPDIELQVSASRSRPDRYIHGSFALHPAAPRAAVIGENGEEILLVSLDGSAGPVGSETDVKTKSRRSSRRRKAASRSRSRARLSSNPPRRAIAEDVRYVIMRVALVGDTGVGKTTLGYRIVEGEFQPQESTHAQQFWSVPNLVAPTNDGVETEVILWDFAGQPEYRIVHSLFLHDIDCALLVFDAANQEDPLKGVRYWIRQLTGPETRKPSLLLVGARADRGIPALSEDEVDAFLADNTLGEVYYQTSAKSGEGIEGLLSAIRLELVRRDAAVTSSPRLFRQLREYIVQLKSNADTQQVLLPVEQLISEVQRGGGAFKSEEVVFAARALRSHGLIELLTDSQSKQHVLLTPDLMIKLASSVVLEARRNERGLGALSEQRLLNDEYGFPDLEGLRKADRNLMLDSAVFLFIQRSICFRETLGSDVFLVFPSLINQARPTTRNADKFIEEVTYRVQGAVEHIYPAMVVLLGYTNTFRRSRQWRDRAEYEVDPGQICGFRQITSEEGYIEFVLHYNAGVSDSTKLLFQGLFEQFLRRRPVSIIRFPAALCVNCGIRQERSTVVRRMAEGRDYLICEECGARLSLSQAEVLTQLAPTYRSLGDEKVTVARRSALQAALVRIKAVVRDRQLSRPSCFISYAWTSKDRGDPWVSQLSKDLADAGVEVVLDLTDNLLGSSIARFISRISSVDYVLVVGTPEYRTKYENTGVVGKVVAAEVDLVHNRLIGTESEKSTIYPLLRMGTQTESFPPLLEGRVYEDFRDDQRYFGALLNLIISLYRIPPDDIGITMARSIVAEVD
jgi:small GTP-binding protein